MILLVAFNDFNDLFPPGKLNSYWLNAPVHVSNKFSVLGNENQQNTDPAIEERSSKPPPIYVDRVSNIQPLTTLLNEVAKEYVIKNIKK